MTKEEFEAHVFQRSKKVSIEGGGVGNFTLDAETPDDEILNGFPEGPDPPPWSFSEKLEDAVDTLRLLEEGRRRHKEAMDRWLRGEEEPEMIPVIAKVEARLRAMGGNHGTAKPNEQGLYDDTLQG